MKKHRLNERRSLVLPGLTQIDFDGGSKELPVGHISHDQFSWGLPRP